MRNAKAALVHAGQIALVVGCCGMSALVTTRFANAAFDLTYSSWSAPRMAVAKSRLLRHGRLWGK